MQQRVVIENVFPEIKKGEGYVKRVVGGGVVVSADIFADGLDLVRAAVLYRHDGDAKWSEILMTDLDEDHWRGRFVTTKRGFYHYTIIAWVDPLATWYERFEKKVAADWRLQRSIEEGLHLLEKTKATYTPARQKPLAKAINHLRQLPNEAAQVEYLLSEKFQQLITDFPFKENKAEYDNNLRVRVGRKRELFSTWYELFPRSTSMMRGGHGTLQDTKRILPRIAEMGFDVLSMPPVNPIGNSHRKGPNNVRDYEGYAPGSPYAIGSASGGHRSIHPKLGTLTDYLDLIKTAQRDHGIEVSHALAFQCSPDHPWIAEHPEWFHWNTDGSIKTVDLPPEDFSDIVELNFEGDHWVELWAALRDLIQFWIDQGIRIFHVDSPHIKPIPFWEWVIAEIHKTNPDIVFLSRAITRPKIMLALAKAGFTQSFTYFMWKNSRWELENYIIELTSGEIRQYLRPNLWPNSIDFLPEGLQGADQRYFLLRVLTAATLSSNYGIYGPAFELMLNEGAAGKEAYANSEKYELKNWDWSVRNRITDAISKVNKLRREHPAMQSIFNLHFSRTAEDDFMSFVKVSEDGKDIIWTFIGFDVNRTYFTDVEVPKKALGITGRVHLKLTDLFDGESFFWFNEWNKVALKPDHMPVRIFKVEKVEG